MPSHTSFGESDSNNCLCSVDLSKIFFLKLKNIYGMISNNFLFIYSLFQTLKSLSCTDVELNPRLDDDIAVMLSNSWLKLISFNLFVCSFAIN